MYSNTITAHMCISKTTENWNSTRKSTRRKRKHIPHAQRSSEYVDRRNRRERNRIQAVNEAFEGLRRKVPTCGQDPELRISKMEVLTNAIGYIEYMCQILGFRNFVEYCRVMGTGKMKENPPAISQGWEAMYNGQKLSICPGGLRESICPGGLRERPTNAGTPWPQTVPSAGPWGSSKPFSTSYCSPETSSSRDCSRMDQTCTYNSHNSGEIETFCEFSEGIFEEPSYAPWNDGQSVNLLNTFQHQSKFNQSDCLYNSVTWN